MTLLKFMVGQDFPMGLDNATSLDLATGVKKYRVSKLYSLHQRRVWMRDCLRLPDAIYCLGMDLGTYCQVFHLWLLNMPVITSLGATGAEKC